MNSRKILTLAAFAVAVAGPALAASPREMLELLAKCAEQSDATERLACYDRLSPQLRETLAGAKKPEERTEEDKISLFGFDFGGMFGSAEGPTTPEEFGKTQMPKEAEPGEVLESISAGVSDFALTPRGKFIVVLENAQVWRQLDSDTSIAHFRKEPKENKVVISRGILGSYNLKLNEQTGIFKVKRLK